jgi:hypothetical protein
VHNKIIEDLDQHVDIATEGLKQEAQHAEQVRKSTRMCYMYICVAVEVVILVILIIVWFMNKG